MASGTDMAGIIAPHPLRTGRALPGQVPHQGDRRPHPRDESDPMREARIDRLHD